MTVEDIDHSSAVRQQTREIGVRIALGATASDLRRPVLGDSLRVVVIRVVIGIVGALAGGGGAFSRHNCPVLRLRTPVAIEFAAGLLVTIGACAAFAPMQRATTIDPVEALRAE